ncbi:YsnF/AvaK domain-containing protein [Clostridium sp. P21]|uniref:YsnF/AvaK domain-containing protein n=1 Tax=Clostridium muellerianum TaxID=2716538 RepID=A0A7Y0HML4_9CLOT|nr:YsnF/AvaK domain-containing protein [Clostridium muellerianum]NMM62295.1 YsnF/AvaK domain-containing protein [Clostridium muellerianum]
MLSKDIPNKRNVQYLTGASIGGIIGFIIAILYKFSILAIPGFITIFAITSIDPMITGTILGIVIGIIIGGLIAQSNTYKDSGERILKDNSHDTNSDVKMQLRKEQMKISKDKIKTGEVSIHKEVLTKEENITVPVKQEELVIEKKVFDPQSQSESNAHTETIRIPISKERIDIHKEPVTLENVSVTKHKYKEIKHITETLKKEIPHVDIRKNNKQKRKR